MKRQRICLALWGSHAARRRQSTITTGAGHIRSRRQRMTGRAHRARHDVENGARREPEERRKRRPPPIGSARAIRTNGTSDKQ